MIPEHLKIAVSVLTPAYPTLAHCVEDAHEEIMRLRSHEVLVQRAYPSLKKSGVCSRCRDDGHFECEICYPDWHGLIDEHMVVSNQLYQQLLELAGLSDPPNGRIGTNAIVAELRRKLTKV